MRSSLDQTKFIESLREMPFIYYATKKVGISRSTIYRWLKNNHDFKERVDSAIEEGRMGTDDIMEMSLINQGKKGNIGAIKFYLTHNHKRYRPTPTLTDPAPPGPGELCKTCGKRDFSNISNEDLDEMINDLENKIKEKKKF